MSPDQDKLNRLMQAVSAALQAADWTGAEAALTQALALVPGEPSLAYNLALVEKRLGKADAAEHRLAVVLETAPGHANARFEYAAALMDRGAEDSALEQFEIYLGAVPDDADAHLNAGRLHLRRGNVRAASDHFTRAAAARPDDPAVRLATAEADRDLGRLGTAVCALWDLYAREPDLRPAILKVMSQGPRGTIPISARRLAPTD